MPVARVLEKGLEFDRRFMLIDEENKFITQRTLPDMALFKTSLHAGSIRINFKNEFLDLPAGPDDKGETVTSMVWSDSVELKLMDELYHNWFSERLGKKCKLVYFPESNLRLVDQEFAKNNEQVSLADGYPFLIIGESSLEDLNSRLSTPVPMNRFRPNFVFAGGQPFEEDSWRNFSIGRNRFVGLKPCARCAIPTINQDTSEKGVEPIATLATFRRRNGNVYFGQNLVAIDHNEVRVGDSIIIESFN